MFAVVGCTDCAALWLLSDPDAAETAQCPRCGRRHRVRKLRRLFASPDRDAARQARAELLAERGDAGDAFADLDAVADLAREAEAPVVDDREYLEAAGVDADAAEAAATSGGGGSRSRDEVVRAAVREGDRPTEAEIVDYATDRGVPAEAARDLLAELVRRGEATEHRGRYRLL